MKIMEYTSRVAKTFHIYLRQLKVNVFNYFFISKESNYFIKSAVWLYVCIHYAFIVHSLCMCAFIDQKQKLTQLYQEQACQLQSWLISLYFM